jgi:alpha-tubulin suppressor-like RCC1 family protein
MGTPVRPPAWERAYCWGFNASGQLGNVTLENGSVPGPVSGGLTFKSIEAGSNHTCAVTFTLFVYCWGDNAFEEVGNPSNNPQLVPIAVLGGSTFQSVSAGYFDSCGVKTGGGGYCWGDNFAGRLGGPVTGTTSTPTLITGGISFRSVTPGGYVTCGLSTTGVAYCWGDNQFGEVGDGSPSSPIVAEPRMVAGGLSFGAVVAGGFHACGITTQQITYCWGRGDAGQLGRPLFTSGTPVRATRIQ